MKRRVLLMTFLVLLGCNQYRCYDGSYVEDAYDCFNHGGLSYYKAPTSRTTPTSYAGTWNMALRTTKNTCPSVPKTLNRKVTISQRVGTLTASVAGTGRYSGRITGRRARFLGTDYSLCRSTYDITTDFSNTTRGTISGTINAICLTLVKCSVSFTGSLSR